MIRLREVDCECGELATYKDEIAGGFYCDACAEELFKERVEEVDCDVDFDTEEERLEYIENAFDYADQGLIEIKEEE